jgi:hypothetical protein
VVDTFDFFTTEVHAEFRLSSLVWFRAAEAAAVPTAEAVASGAFVVTLLLSFLNCKVPSFCVTPDFAWRTVDDANICAVMWACEEAVSYMLGIAFGERGAETCEKGEGGGACSRAYRSDAATSWLRCQKSHGGLLSSLL